ncbi:12265_t:CDS:1, partial [Funneliformis geosporum]
SISREEYPQTTYIQHSTFHPRTFFGMYFVYVLKCRNNKYYVGRTMNIDVRYQMDVAQSGHVDIVQSESKS